MTRELVEIEYKGLTCVGRVIVGDWEGDASVTRGVNRLPPYVEDLEIFAGADEPDIYSMFTEEARDEIIEKILESDA